MKRNQLIIVIIVVFVLAMAAYLVKTMSRQRISCIDGISYTQAHRAGELIRKDTSISNSENFYVPIYSKIMDYNKVFFKNMLKEGVEKKASEMKWKQVDYYKKGNKETLVYEWEIFIISFYFLEGKLKKIKEEVGYVKSSNE
jgi:hypothetical protein